VTFKATGEQTGGEFVVAEQLWRQRFATPLHRHPEDPESFYVIEGRLTFYVGDGEPIRASAGAFVHVPADTPHAFRVESETAKLLQLTTPQIERFHRAAGEPAPVPELPPPDDPRSRVDVEKLRAGGTQFGTEILGPPPTAEAPDLLGPAAVPNYDHVR
jgi:quercetin dioxygenase-like cupin family protein